MGSVPAAGGRGHGRRQGGGRSSGGGGGSCCCWRDVVGCFDGWDWSGWCCTCFRLKDCCIGGGGIAGRVFGSGRSVEGGGGTRRGHNNGRRLAYRVKAIEQILLPV